MDEKTVKDLVIQGLENGGFDGLVSVGGSCCCYLDKNNCPCEKVNGECKAGNIITTNIEVRTVKSGFPGCLSVEPPWEEVD